MKKIRDIIYIDDELCNGCGQCVPSCAEGALQIVDGKARLVAEKYCDGLGACLGECPTGALTIIQRESDPFDEEAVEELLAGNEAAEQAPAQPRGGCPSARAMSLKPAREPVRPGQAALPGDSALANWPVKLKLANAEAPFFKEADLLIAADCVPAASGAYHAELLPGKVAVIGCPKFDDAREYVLKLAEIIKKNSIRSITVAEMEVPCCASLSRIVSRAMTLAGEGPVSERVVISRQGKIISRGEMAHDEPLAAM